MTFPRRFEPVVTDHAVVRWLERVQHFDIEAVRAEILDHGRDAWVAQGAVTVRVPDLGISLIAQDGRVISVMPHARRSRS